MYRKNVAGQYLYFALINASTGAALTGATVTGKRAIDGAAQASVTGTITEEAGGQYKIALSQADINGNNIGFLFTATSAIPVSISVVTTAADPTDSVRFGLTALPNAAASAVGGLPLSVDTSGRVDVLKINGTSQTARDIGASVLLSTGTGTGQLDFTSGVVKANATQLLGTAWLTPAVAGTPDVNAKQLGGTAQTGRDVGASVLLSAGSGTGQLDFTSGVVKANLAQILGTALTETAGQIAAAFKKFFDLALPSGTVNTTPFVGTVTGSVGSVNGSVTGNVNGSVGSVTGAVGSVTGDVGGNVVGTVASVVGAVGSVTGNVGGSVASVTADCGITQGAADKVFSSSGAALAELSQAQPSATPRPDQAVMLLYMSLRNTLTTTASTKSVTNNAGTVITKKALADDGTTYTETKMVTGP